jgi:hypothetical protein
MISMRSATHSWETGLYWPSVHFLELLQFQIRWRSCIPCTHVRIMLTRAALLIIVSVPSIKVKSEGFCVMNKTINGMSTFLGCSTLVFSLVILNFFHVCPFYAWSQNCVMSVYPSVSHSAPTRRILMKLDIWALFENLLRNVSLIKTRQE